MKMDTTLRPQDKRTIAIVLYIGIIHTEYYYSHEKSIFIIGFFACVIVSGVLSAIYSSIRWLKDKNGNYIYDENDDDDLLDGNTDSAARKTARRTLEIIFCSILFVANVLCLIVVISHISKKSKYYLIIFVNESVFLTICAVFIRKSLLFCQK